MYKLIAVYHNGEITQSNGFSPDGKEYTIGDWPTFFTTDENLEYLEYRTPEGKKHREFSRNNYYKHLAGEIK